MHPRLAAIVPHTLMLAVSGLLYFAATRIEVGALSGRIGPDGWPKLIIGAMAALCVYEIIKRLLIGTSFTATGLIQGLNRPPAVLWVAVDGTAGATETSVLSVSLEATIN